MQPARLLVAVLLLAATAALAGEDQVSQVAEDYLDSWLFKDYEEMFRKALAR